MIIRKLNMYTHNQYDIHPYIIFSKNTFNYSTDNETKSLHINCTNLRGKMIKNRWLEPYLSRNFSLKTFF